MKIKIRKEKKAAEENNDNTMDEKLNDLRAGVLGSNDGILTVVGVLFSVAVANASPMTIFIAGLSDLLACAFSMAGGEYASVSSQRDTEKAAVNKESRLLKTNFKGELQAVADFYAERGVSTETSMEIAKDLLAKKPLASVVSVKYDLQLGQYLSPWAAAFSSLCSASLGGLLPLMAMTLFTPFNLQWPATIIAVIIAVGLTGYLSAILGNGMIKVAVIRNIIVGILTMCIHYGLGQLFLL